MKPQRLLDLLASLAVLLGLVALWWWATEAGWVSRAFLPSPQAAWASLRDGLIGGDLAAYTLATVGRMALGWLLASLLGVALGAALGSSAAARAWLLPTLEFLRPLPASALLPVGVALFGLSAGTVLGVVAFGSMWPVLLATVHGFASVHPRLDEVARALQIGRGRFLLQIGLPHAMPDILAGMRLSLTVSLIVAVVGEMLASQPGLGQSILLAARSYRADELFAGVILLGAIGCVSNLLLAAAEHRLLRWQRL